MANIIWFLFVLLLTTIKINYETNKKYFLFFWEIVVEHVSVIAQFFINRVAKYDNFSTSLGSRAATTSSRSASRGASRALETSALESLPINLGVVRHCLVKVL
jgi:hypothetical protein